MAQNWEVAEVNQWLGDGKGKWSKSGSETSYENQSFHNVFILFIYLLRYDCFLKYVKSWLKFIKEKSLSYKIYIGQKF